MAKISIKLSSHDINSAITKLRHLQNELPNAIDDAIKDIANETKKKAVEVYNSMIETSTSDTTPDFKVENTDNGYKVLAIGSSVLYDEFGTGDEGFKSRHPRKKEFDLYPYNYHLASKHRGTIRPADNISAEHGITSGLYWTYQDSNGKHFTQGIPSGQFMYQADIWLRDNYKEIIKKKVDDVLSKL